MRAQSIDGTPTPRVRVDDFPLRPQSEPNRWLFVGPLAFAQPVDAVEQRVAFARYSLAEEHFSRADE